MVVLCPGQRYACETSVEMGLRIPPAIRIPPLFSRFLKCSLLAQEEAIRITPPLKLNLVFEDFETRGSGNS